MEALVPLSDRHRGQQVEPRRHTHRPLWCVDYPLALRREKPGDARQAAIRRGKTRGVDSHATSDSHHAWSGLHHAPAERPGSWCARAGSWSARASSWIARDGAPARRDLASAARTLDVSHAPGPRFAAADVPSLGNHASSERTDASVRPDHPSSRESNARSRATDSRSARTSSSATAAGSWCKEADAWCHRDHASAPSPPRASPLRQRRGAQRRQSPDLVCDYFIVDSNTYVSNEKPIVAADLPPFREFATGILAPQR
jgi:hypothetical protein